MLLKTLKLASRCRAVPGLAAGPRQWASSLPAQIEPKDPENALAQKEAPRERRERLFHLSRHVADMLRKKMDVLKAEEGLLAKQKVVLEPARERHRLDDFDFLRANREVPCLIAARGELPPIDLVLHWSQARQLSKEQLGAGRAIFVSYRGEEIRCTVERIALSPDKSFYTEVLLRRYIVGEPNEVMVEVFAHPRPHAALTHRRFEWIKEQVRLVSYGEVYPTRVEIDYVRLMRSHRFTFGDLRDILPRGLELHPAYQPMLHLDIVRLIPLESKYELDVEHRMKMNLPTVRELNRLQDIEAGRLSEDAVTDQRAVRTKTGKSGDKIRKTRSLKKIIMADQDKLKAKLASHMAAPEATAAKGKKR